MTKVYFVFAYWGYYPSGGWDDFQKSFTCESEAKMYASEITSQDSRASFDYAQVVDVETEKVIFKTGLKSAAF